MHSSITTGVIISGGALRRNWAPKRDKIQDVEDSSFLTLSKQDPELRKFLGATLKSFAGTGAFDCIAQAREDAQVKWLSSKQMEGAIDPMDPMAQASPSVLSAADRRRMKAELPMIVTVTIEASGGCPQHVMRVLSSASVAANVAMELTQGNLDWLQEAIQKGNFARRPRKKAGSKEVMSGLGPNCKDIKWRGSRKTLWTTYKQSGKNKTLSKRIFECSDEERNEKPGRNLLKRCRGF